MTRRKKTTLLRRPTNKKKRVMIHKIQMLRKMSKFRKNLTILTTCLHLRVFTVESTTLDVLFNAGARTAINGSATVKVRTTTEVIYSGTW